MGLAVADAHAVDDDRSHLAIEHFLGARDFFLEARRERHNFERRAGLVDVADGVVLQHVGANFLFDVGIEGWAVDQR